MLARYVVLLIVVVLASFSSVDAQLGLVFPSANVNLYAGVPSGPISFSFANPQPIIPTDTTPPEQNTSYAVAATASLQGGSGFAIAPTNFMLNSTNFFTSTFTLTPSGSPPTFGSNGFVPQSYNITWSLAPGQSGSTYPPFPQQFLQITVSPRPVLVCVNDPTVPGGIDCGGNLTLTLIDHLPSEPITVQPTFAPPNGTTLTVSFNTSQNLPQPLQFSPATSLALSFAQPTGSFTVTSLGFNNFGAIGLLFSGTAAPYYVPSLPFVLSFGSQLIPVRITNLPTTMIAGEPYLFTIALDLPVPVTNPSVPLVVIGQSGQTGPLAPIFSPPSVTFSGSVVAQNMSITMPAVPNNNLLTTQVYFSLSPSYYDTGGPFTITSVGSYENPAQVTVVQRTLTPQFPNTPLFVGEAFPLLLQIAYPTPVSLTVTLDDSGAPGTNGEGMLQFSPNVVQFTGTVTQQLVWVTVTSFPLPPNPAPPFLSLYQQTVQISLYLNDVDAPLYSAFTQTGNLLTTTFNVSRRLLLAKASTQLGGGTLQLVPGQPSEPINVYLSHPYVLQLLQAPVVLTPFVNTPDLLVVFDPPQLTFAPGTALAGATQTIQVAVVPQPKNGLGGSGVSFAVQWAVSASPADQSLLSLASTYAITGFPSFSVNPPSFSLFFPGTNQGPAAGNALNVLAGDTVLCVASLQYLPLFDLTLTAFAPDVLINAVDPVGGNTSRNAATAYSASQTVLPAGPSVLVFSFQPLSYGLYARNVQWMLSGSDAAFYSPPGAVAITVLPRSITLPSVAYQNVLGALSNEIYITLSDLPLNDITISLFPHSPDSGLVFANDTITFTGTNSSAGPSSLSLPFKWSGTVPGSFVVYFVLSGTDAGWYQFAGAAPLQSFVVTLRAAPLISPPLSAAPVQPYQWLGPFTVTLQTPATNGLVITPYNANWNFTPTSVALPAGSSAAVFNAVYWPPSTPTTAEATVTTIFFTVSGPDAWLYLLPPPATLLAAPVSIARRPITVTLLGLSPAGAPQVVLAGASMYGNVRVATHPPQGLVVTPWAPGVVFTPASWSFTPAQATVQFTYVASVSPSQYTARSGVLGLASTVPVYYNVSGPDAPLYQVPAQDAITVQLRQLVIDVGVTDLNLNQIRNPLTGGFATSQSQFLLGVTYPNIFTISAVSPPTTSVTLTPTCAFVTFSPATVTFSQQQLSFTFSFTPTSVPAQSSTVRIDWILSGPDELLFTTQALDVVGTLSIVPPLNVTKLPALYIDQSTAPGNLTVAPGATVAIGTNIEPFVVWVTLTTLNDGGLGCDDCVVVRPNTFAFSSATPQSFVIRHVRPSGIPATGYRLQWWFRTVSTQVANAVQLVNLNVNPAYSVVQVLRYGIVPDFPFTLGYRFCTAGVNLTRPPWGTVTLTPSYMFERGSGFERSEGIKAAGGRVIFDPPVISFPPGQSYQQFQVRIDRRIDDTAMYYRVDWTISTAVDDGACYLPFQSTWHVGGATRHLLHAGVLLLAIAGSALLILL